jgi:hypothetical protein
VGDTADFADTGYIQDTGVGAAYWDAALSDILSELENINVQTAHIQAASLATDRPLRYPTGTPLLIEQWEHGVNGWEWASGGTGASVSRISNLSWTKGYCIKMVGGSDGARYATLSMQLGAYPKGKGGFQFAIAGNNHWDYLYIDTMFPYKGMYIWPGMVIDRGDNELLLYDVDWDEVVYWTALPWNFGSDRWQFIKFTWDWDAGTWDTLYFNEYKEDISAYTLPKEEGDITDDVYLGFYLKSLAGQNGTIYIDDICLTEEV